MKTLKHQKKTRKKLVFSKNFKSNLMTLIALLFAFNITHSQDEATMFVLHTDNVKFEKIPAYEKVAKELKDNFTKYNLKDNNWTTVNTQDGRYVYVTPIKNMAELDKNIMKGLTDKIGEEAVNTMLDSMDDCYDTHSDKIIHYIKDLSYEPEGYTTAGKNYREYHFIYYAPKNAKKIKEAIANVKALYVKKGIKNGYTIFHSGFGNEKNYFMVSVAGKDKLEIAQIDKIEEKQLGEELDPTMFNVIALSTKYEKVEARVRPDLSYYPKE
ncbi:hypothetical protein [Lacinutrix venerupis]|uniref:Uncharacterized protein n=1 Tax=Lacinutrix venerupis TaxID=1486034 RepID=A0AAC9PWD7_9FLAO|nr:hypothetical protein [Lacinutrix venerupis]APX99980.1 hypothetical protein BWR22_06550 [Lacinutrix venerupis]